MAPHLAIIVLLSSNQHSPDIKRDVMTWPPYITEIQLQKCSTEQGPCDAALPHLSINGRARKFYKCMLTSLEQPIGIQKE